MYNMYVRMYVLSLLKTDDINYANKILISLRMYLYVQRILCTVCIYVCMYVQYVTNGFKRIELTANVPCPNLA